MSNTVYPAKYGVATDAEIAALAPVQSVNGSTGAVTVSATWPLGVFGDGSDGVADLNGSNSIAWCSKSGNVYTMTRNAWCTNVTVRAGCTLVKRFILYVNGTLTVEATGIVHDDGNAASGGTAGAQMGFTGRLPQSTGAAGASGRNTSGAGANGSSNTDAYGGAGGNGGISGLGQAGGTGGTAAEPANTESNNLRGLGFLGIPLLQSGTGFIRASGGGGGGAGGCNPGTGTATSGGGGGGGCDSMLVAKTISNLGVIRANGGAGGDAVATGNGQAGGGGGGGGGRLIIVSNTALASAGTIQCNGGAPGNGAGGGAVGIQGSNGVVDYRSAA